MARLAGRPYAANYAERVAAVNDFNSRVNRITMDALNSGQPHPQLPVYRHPEPDVLISYKYKKNSVPSQDYPIDSGKYIRFAQFQNLPMGDWDWADPIHASSSVNIENLGDVYERVNRFAADNPNSRFRMYLTPGGVRGFEVANPMTAREFTDRGYFDQLQVDPNYAMLATRQTPLNYTTAFAPTESFNSRTSGKPGRPEDFVAWYLGDIGGGMPHPESRRLVAQYHDMPIVRQLAKEGVTPEPHVLPMSGLELVESQLSTVPADFRQQIERGLILSRAYRDRFAG